MGRRLSVDRGTVEVYEREAARWREERRASAMVRRRAMAFGARVRAVRRGAAGRPVLDAGCGPGWYTGPVGGGEPVVAMDAARAMLDLARGEAPAAWAVQASLDALPFARGSLGGAWGVRSYVHLPRAAVPLALHDLHRSLAVGAPVELVVFGGDVEFDAWPNDDFAGRRFSTWPRQLLGDVVIGAGFDLDELAVDIDVHGNEQLTVQATRARTLADTVGTDMRVLVCGLNPSVYAADAGAGFARPGNRFWPAAMAAGLVSRDCDPLHALRFDGVGMTDLVKRATPRADSLTADEYRAGLDRLARLSTWLRPRLIAFVGLAGWRAAVDRTAVPGPQPTTVGGCPVYLLPSTSGANASATLPVLTEHLRTVTALTG